MKNKKKIIIASVILLAVIIAAAGIIIAQESKKAYDRGNVQTSAVQRENGEEQSVPDKTTEKTAKFSFGETDGKSYYNSFAGLMFNLPSDDWSFLNTKETAKLTGAKVNKSRAIISNDHGKGYYDACIYDSKTKSTVQFMLFKSEDKKELSPKQMVNAITDEKKDSLKDFKHGEFYEKQVADSTYLCTDCVYTQNDTEKRSTLAVRKIGKDFICITTDLILNNDENLSSDYLSIFREYKA